jgi:ferritin-like metal-binding protein YciE
MAKKRTSRKQSRKQSPGGSELLMLELQQIHSAENQLVRALPRFAKVVESESLRRMVEQRMKQGERLLEEVESTLEELDGGSRRMKNVAAEGLINDTREHLRIPPMSAGDSG